MPEEGGVRVVMHRDASFDPVRQTWYAARSAHVGHDIEKELLDVSSSRLAYMDATGISLQVLSLTTPGCQAFAGDQAISMARDANDRMAAAVTTHPDRFCAFAALPTSELPAALSEFETRLDQGFVGAMINGHTAGRFLDDEAFGPCCNWRSSAMFRSTCIQERLTRG